MRIHPTVTVPIRSASPASELKLQKAAEEFESCFTRQLLAPMQEKGTGEGDDSAAGFDTLQDFSSGALAAALAHSGGLGLARSVLEKLGPFPETESSTSVTGGGKPFQPPVK